jgi:diguanylate cyclase (GGDEF)-like protein
LAKAKVLLVEDDPLQTKETKEKLERAGYEVICSADGINAIKLVKSEMPDIVLLDLILPGLDGHEVCRWIKLEETTKGIPIIMLTVKKELSDKVSALQVGADDFLPKPYDNLELNARIYAALRTKALQDELRMKNEKLEELLSKVEYMAVTDALTGLYNRRRFHSILETEFERSKRYSTPFSLIMLDVDHFKRINDNYGHQVGDSVLKQIAQIFLKDIREIDTASRYGGEEFMVILPNTDKKDARFVAERMRIDVEKNKFSEIGDDGVTVSIGSTGLPDKSIENEDKLISCVDFALYRAKQNGRNRTEIIAGSEFQSSLGKQAGFS